MWVGDCKGKSVFLNLHNDIDTLMRVPRSRNRWLHGTSAKTSFLWLFCYSNTKTTQRRCFGWFFCAVWFTTSCLFRFLLFFNEQTKDTHGRNAELFALWKPCAPYQQSDCFLGFVFGALPEPLSSDHCCHGLSPNVGLL